MSNLQLQKVIYKKVDSLFDIKEDIELRVQNSFSMNVNYDYENKMCIATLNNLTNAPDSPDSFHINLEVIGIFSYQGIESDEDRKEAHIQIYNFLFPYMQSMVADLSGKAGLPPLMIEMTKIDPGDVNIDE